MHIHKKFHVVWKATPIQGYVFVDLNIVGRWCCYSNRLSPSTVKKRAISRATRSSLRRSDGPSTSASLLAAAGMRGVPGSFGGRACIALGFRSSSSFVPPAPFISLARVRVPVQLSGDDGNGGVVSGEICMRLVLVFLLALGKDLMCSPVSFT